SGTLTVNCFLLILILTLNIVWYNKIMAKYPIFLELGGRRCVVIGGGAVAVRKAQALLNAGARLVVVADRIDNMMTVNCQGKNAELIKSRYSKDYLAGAVLVIAATNNNTLNKQIYKDCQELEILCNVVDVPDLCDFYVPAVVKRGDLQIAIGTEGRCPAYAGHIRKKLEKIFTEKHGQFLAELEGLRKRIIKEVAEPADRKALLGELADDKSFEFFVENDQDQWQIFVEKLINKLLITRK
ncbi:MAG: precorrin-2 dehydrogenase/sirohydrochlorin ferrochelatase family protein, partial [Planctomycetota bacterium]